MLEAGVAAVAEACRVTRVVQSGMAEVQRIVKDDRSPVTVADFASQAVIGRGLRERLGGTLLMVGEETSAALRNPEHRAALDATLAAAREVWPEAEESSLLEAIDLGAGDPHHSAFWTLDPIDGTKGFLRGQQYAVSLAYIERGQVVLGVMGCPNLARDFSKGFDEADRHGCLYSCLRGQGVYEVGCDGALRGDRPTRVSRAEPVLSGKPDEGVGLTVCVSVEESHSHAGKTAAVMSWLETRGVAMSEPMRLDSQAKYAVVARGQADVYLRLPTKREYVEFIWDHAAGALMAMEMGLSVTDAVGKELDFGQGRRLERNRGVVVGPTWVHGQVLGAIAEVGV